MLVKCGVAYILKNRLHCWEFLSVIHFCRFALSRSCLFTVMTIMFETQRVRPLLTHSPFEEWNSFKTSKKKKKKKKNVLLFFEVIISFGKHDRNLM